MKQNRNLNLGRASVLAIGVWNFLIFAIHAAFFFGNLQSRVPFTFSQQSCAFFAIHNSDYQTLDIRTHDPNFGRQRGLLGSRFALSKGPKNAMHPAPDIRNKDSTRASSCMPQHEKLGQKHVSNGIFMRTRQKQKCSTFV